MKKILFLLFISAHSLLFSQSSLFERNKYKIGIMFAQENEFDSVFNFYNTPRFLFRTELTYLEGINLKYYKMGYVCGRKRIFICYVYNGKFELFRTRDFDKEFNEVFKPLIENEVNLNSGSLLHLIKSIRSVYNYNDKINNIQN